MKFMLALVGSLAIVLVSGAETTLKQDMDEFLALLPQDKILFILLDHLSSDSELQDVVLYLQTDSFRNLLTTVEALPEFQQAVKYLDSEGVDILQIIDLVKGGGAGQLPPALGRADRKTLLQLLSQITALLPAERIQQLYADKMETSSHFAAFVEHLHGPEVQVIVSTMEAMPEYQEMVDRLLAKGVDPANVVAYIRWLFTGETTK